MATPLTRPIQDYSLVRRTSGADLTTSLGQSLGAVFSTPMEGGLVAESFRRAGARLNEFTPEQRQQLSQTEIEYTAEIRHISQQLGNFLISDTERDALRARIAELNKKRKVQLDSFTQEALEAGRIVEPEQLAQEYGDLGLRFDRPMTKEEAKLLADGKRAEIIRNAIIEKGPQGVGPGILKFGAGMLAVATDPIGLASMFIPIVGPGGKVLLTTRLGAFGGRVAEGVIEGGIGNLLVEPLYYSLSRQAQLDYDMTDALFNVGVGFALGGAIGAGAATVSRLRGGPRRAAETPAGGVPTREAAGPVRGATERPVERTSVEHQRDVAQTAVRQFVNDDPIDIRRLIDGTDLRSTTTLSRIDGYEFQRRQFLDDIESRPQRPTYMAADDEGLLRFDTQAEAEGFAREVGGNVVPLGDGFGIRQVASGDVLRKPSGQVATFRDPAVAERLADRLRAEGDNVDVVQRPQGDYVITKDMTLEDIENIRAAAETLEIPPGVNAKELATRMGQVEAIDKVVRGVAAERMIAAKMLQDRVAAERTNFEAEAAREVDEELASARTEEIQALEEEIAQLEGQLKESGILARTGDELDDEIPDFGSDPATRFQALPVDPMFFSPTLRAVTEAKQTKAKPQEWMAIISKTPGVKKDEYEWLGVPEYLAGRGKETVTKEELDAYIRSQSISLEEIELNQDNTSIFQDDFEFPDSGFTRWEEYTEPGGENYREILLTVPNLETRGPNRGQQKSPFVSRSHFDEPNIVVHARVNDRVGPNGEKVLFIEEIQSDLGTVWREAPDEDQIARDVEINERFQESLAKQQTLESEIDELVKKETTTTFQPASYHHPDRILQWLDVEEAPSDVPSVNMFIEVLRENASARDLYERFVSQRKETALISEERLRNGTLKKLDPSVPQTPFRGANTYALMIRRLMREAAEKGYDRVSWTPSDMQIARWGEDFAEGYKNVYDRIIRKEVERIAKKNGGKVYVDKTLPDFVTMEQPWKLEVKAIKDWKESVGNDAFEAQAIESASILDRGERLGAFTTQTVTALSDKPDYWIGGLPSGVVSHMAEKLGLSVREPQIVSIDPVWSVDITPQMREAAMQPQPVLQTAFPGSMHVRADIAEEALPALREELDAMGLTDVNLRLDRSAKNWQGAFKPSWFGPLDIIIANAIDPKATMHHESIHAMRWMDLFTPEEWSLLERSADEVWMDQFNIGERYGELSREQQLEEAIAEAFGEFASAQTRPESRLLQIWQKVERVFAAIRAAFKGKTAEDVFGDAYSGRIGGRERGERRGFGTMRRQAVRQTLVEEVIRNPRITPEAFEAMAMTPEQIRELSEAYKQFLSETTGRGIEDLQASIRSQMERVFNARMAEATKDFAGRDLNKALDMIARDGSLENAVRKELNNEALQVELMGEALSGQALGDRVMSVVERSQQNSPMWRITDALGRAESDNKLDGDWMLSMAEWAYTRSLVNDLLATKEQRQPSPQDLLSPETRAALDELPELDKRFEAWQRAVEVAANCVGMRP